MKASYIGIQPYDFISHMKVNVYIKFNIYLNKKISNKNDGSPYRDSTNLIQDTHEI